MSPPHIAYLGPPASFSHSAALDFLSSSSSFSTADTTTTSSPPKSSPTSPSVLSYPSFTAIFSALQSSSPSSPSSSDPSQQITHAIVPFENSSNGVVAGVLDLLADPRGLYPDLRVCAEYYLPVHHYFLVKPSGGNGSSSASSREERIARVKRIHTHPQVWGQCVRFLEQRCRPGVERVDMASTSLAARYVSSIGGGDGVGGEGRADGEGEGEEEGEGEMAAIGSVLAAQVNGLEVLAEEIEDEGNNTTRFLVLCKAAPTQDGTTTTTTTTKPSSSTATKPDTSPSKTSAEHQHQHQRQGQDQGQEQGQGREGRQVKHKSLISFTLNHARPGSLADALAAFRAHGFNLTSIDTRPSRERHWHYIFLVECEEVRLEEEKGEEKGEGEGEANLWNMLAGLREVAERVRFWGCWVDALGGKGR